MSLTYFQVITSTGTDNQA